MPTPVDQLDPLGDVRFVAQAGHAYPISVSPVSQYSAEPIQLRIFLQPFPPNDCFTNGIRAASYEAQGRGDSFGASAELGEPGHGGQPPRHSLWWSWTAPGTGRLLIQAITQGRYALYTGDDVKALQVVPTRAQNPVLPPEPTDYVVEAGRTCHLALDDDGETHVLGLTLRLTPEARCGIRTPGRMRQRSLLTTQARRFCRAWADHPM